MSIIKGIDIGKRAIMAQTEAIKITGQNITNLSLFKLHALLLSTPVTSKNLPQLELIRRLINLRPCIYYDTMENTEAWTIQHLESGGSASNATPSYPTTDQLRMTCAAAADDLIRMRFRNKSTLDLVLRYFLVTVSDVAVQRTGTVEIRDSNLAEVETGVCQFADMDAAAYYWYQTYISGSAVRAALYFPHTVIQPNYYVDFFLADTLGNDETIDFNIGVYAVTPGANL